MNRTPASASRTATEAIAATCLLLLRVPKRQFRQLQERQGVLGARNAELTCTTGALRVSEARLAAHRRIGRSTRRLPSPWRACNPVTRIAQGRIRLRVIDHSLPRCDKPSRIVSAMLAMIAQVDHFVALPRSPCVSEAARPRQPQRFRLKGPIMRGGPARSCPHAPWPVSHHQTL
jgi:hypothetical protein